MPDEATQDPGTTQDTPDEAQTEAPPQGTREVEPEADTQDWEKRYKDLQSEYTRAQQQNAQYEAAIEIAQDPEHPQYAEAREVLRLEAQRAEDDDEYEDPVDELRAEIEALKTERRSEKERAQWDTLVNGVETHVADLTKDLKLTDRQRQAIVREALDEDEPTHERTIEIVKEWEADLDKDLEGRWKAYKDTKRVTAPGSGAAAVEKIDKSDPKQRVEYANRRFEELTAEQ